MNLSEIRTQSMALYKEKSTTTSYILAADWNQFINEGIKEICTKAFVYRITKTATISTTVASYTFPWNFLRLGALISVNGTPLDEIQPSEVGRRFIVTGRPLYFYMSQTPLVYTTRANGTVYTAGSFIVPASPNGYLYECVTGGTSGGAPPAVYPITWGTTVSDGTVTWGCREMMGNIKTFTLVDTPTTAGGGTGSYTLVYDALDNGLNTDTASPNFPVEYHRLLCLYACHRAAIAAKNQQLAMGFLNDFGSALGLHVGVTKDA